MKTSLTLQPSPGWYPPNNTTCLVSIRTKEKLLQGGGLVPVTGGVYHVSEEVKRAIINYDNYDNIHCSGS